MSNPLRGVESGGEVPASTPSTPKTWAKKPHSPASAEKTDETAGPVIGAKREGASKVQATVTHPLPPSAAPHEPVKPVLSKKQLQKGLKEAIENRDIAAVAHWLHEGAVPTKEQLKTMKKTGHPIHRLLSVRSLDEVERKDAERLFFSAVKEGKNNQLIDAFVKVGMNVNLQDEEKTLWKAIKDKNYTNDDELRVIAQNFKRAGLRADGEVLQALKDDPEKRWAAARIKIVEDELNIPK